MSSSIIIIEHKLQKNLKWSSMKLGPEIGRGKFGICYTCTDLQTNRSYAAKIIKFDDEDKQSTILKEIHLLEMLSKFSIEQLIFPKYYGHVYYISPANEHIYAMVSEKANGDLNSLIEQRKKGLNYRENLALMACLARGLLFLKGRKMVHGDLKPENILYFINKDQEISFKIGDFGEGELNVGEKIRVRGTKRYFAPEMNYCYLNKIKMLNPEKSDVYSVGLILLDVNLRNLKFFEAEEDKHLREQEKVCNPSKRERGPYDEKIKTAINKVLERFCHITDKERKILRRILRDSLQYNPAKRFTPEELEKQVNDLIALQEVELESDNDNDGTIKRTISKHAQRSLDLCLKVIN